MFEPGHRPYPGRPKGQPNKSSMRAELSCQVRGYDSIDSMINAAEIALKRFIEQTQMEESGKISLMESKACDYLKLYVKIASEIANYIYPKRKALEVTHTDPLKEMTPIQKLEAMKSAVKMLELQMKSSDGTGSGDL